MKDMHLNQSKLTRDSEEKRCMQMEITRFNAAKALRADLKKKAETL